MRKILCAVAFMAFLGSCSSDDKSPVESVDPIVRTWRMSTVKHNGVLQTELCQDMHRLQFEAGNKGTARWYFEDNGECEAMIFDNLTWTKTGSEYHLFGTTAGTYFEFFADSATFQGNTMKTLQQDGDVLIEINWVSDY